MRILSLKFKIINEFHFCSNSRKKKKIQSNYALAYSNIYNIRNLLKVVLERYQHNIINNIVWQFLCWFNSFEDFCFANSFVSSISICSLFIIRLLSWMKYTIFICEREESSQYKITKEVSCRIKKKCNLLLLNIWKISKKYCKN